MGNEIVLASIGSLGDIHPLVAVGLALNSRGITTRLAVPEDNVKKVQAAGLQAAGIFPSADHVCHELGMSSHDVAARVMRDQEFMMRELVLGYLERCVRSLDEVAENAKAIVGPILSPAGAIVAEMRGIPHIPVALQPMVILSAYAPPYDPGYPFFFQAPRLAASRGVNRASLAMLKAFLRWKYLKLINDVRQRLGLEKSDVTPVFGLSGREPMVLGLYSSVLGSVQPDFPVNTILTGFPIFDADEPDRPDADANLIDALEFCKRGSAPIVFTLGSFAVFAPGDFYQTSLAVARRLGRRSLLLVGQNEVSVEGDDVFVARYLPHSKVFHRASLIVHHGGIGTTAQALRAGKPQVVVPHFADQFDNARRLERDRLAISVPGRSYGIDRATRAIERALHLDANGQIREAQRIVSAETGADTAATAIITALG